MIDCAGNSNCFTQSENRINGRGAWHYLISTPIGDFHIVEYEKYEKPIEKDLKRYMFDSNDAAVRKLHSILRGMVSGTI
jgi:hypothetical protein